MSMVANFLARLSLMSMFRQFFVRGVYSAGVVEAAEIQVQVMEAEDKVFEKAVELTRKARPLRESDDEFERQLAADHAQTLRETMQLGRAMLGQATPEERREVLSGPLSDSLDGSTPSLPAADQSPSLTPEPKSADHHPSNGSGTPTQPAKKRGRPSNQELERRKALARNETPHSGGPSSNGQ